MVEKKTYLEHCGTLLNVLTAKEKAQIERFFLSGYINQKDIDSLHDMVMNDHLTHIDMHNAQLTTVCSWLFQNAQNLNSIILPCNINKIGDKAFYNSNLSYIYFPDSIETIGIDAFKHTQLTYIHIPNSVKTIQKGAFANTPLEYVFLQNVERIESKAFSGCKMLKEVRCKQTLPPLIAADTFSDCKQCLLIIPKGCKNNYEKAQGWSMFKNVVEENDVEFTEDIYQQQTAQTPTKNSKQKIGCSLLGFILLFILICAISIIANAVTL